MSSRRVLGVDIDNVLARTDFKVRQLFASRYGLNVRQEQIVQFDYHRCLPLTKQQVSRVFRELYETHLGSIPVIRGARKTLEIVRPRYVIHLVTSRPVSSEGPTVEWLRTKRIPFDRLIFSDEKHRMEVRPDIFVEDKWDFAYELAEAGTLVLLLDYPWNRNKGDHQQIRRVKSWSQIRKCLEIN